MKFYKPLFSVIIILIQLSLSVLTHFDYIRSTEKLKTENPDLWELISYRTTYDSLFLFVLIIGIYEMTTKPSLFKTFVRVFLVCIILGTQFSGIIPIEDFYFGVYNTSWFSAVLAFLLILTKIGINIVSRNKIKKPAGNNV